MVAQTCKFILRQLQASAVCSNHIHWGMPCCLWRTGFSLTTNRKYTMDRVVIKIWGYSSTYNLTFVPGHVEKTHEKLLYSTISDKCSNCALHTITWQGGMVTYLCSGCVSLTLNYKPCCHPNALKHHLLPVMDWWSLSKFLTFKKLLSLQILLYVRTSSAYSAFVLLSLSR